MLVNAKHTPSLDKCCSFNCLQPSVRIRFLLLLISFAMLGGCASANDRFETLNAQLAKPINCEHAQMQIDLLENAKVSKSEKIVNGIASILPTSIILNLITGEYTSRAQIASGKFDNILYMKIDEINMQCEEAMLSSTKPNTSLNKLARTAGPLLAK